MTEFLHEVVKRRERAEESRQLMSYSNNLQREMQASYERLVASAVRVDGLVRPPSITRDGNAYVNVSGYSYVRQSNWPLSADLMSSIARHSTAQPFHEHLMECPQNGEGFELRSIEWTGPRTSYDTYRYECIGCRHQQSVAMPRLHRLPGLAV